MTPPLNLDAIKARVEAATSGPWMVDSGMNYTTEGDSTFQHILASGGDNPDCGRGICSTTHSPSMKIPWDGKLDYLPPRHGRMEDAVFIAHSREDIPALVAEVERLRALLRGAA